MTPLRVHNQSKFRYPLTNLTTSDRWTVRSLRKWAILAVPKEPHPIDKAVIQVAADASGEVLYTYRTKGRSFESRVFEGGAYTVRVTDPDSGYEQIYAAMEARRSP